MSTTRKVKIACAECGKSFTASQHSLLDRWIGSLVCSRCASARASLQDRRARQEREALWQKVCPSLYRECAPDKLPSDHARKALKAALSWSPANGRGFGLVGGKSGQGKTRILFAAARPHFLAGRSFTAVNCGALGVDISASIGANLRELLRPLKGVGLLLMDDLGKERSTPHVAAAFYNIIESRTSRELPTLFSANYLGDELADKLGDQNGPYIVRRLREFSPSIVIR